MGLFGKSQREQVVTLATILGNIYERTAGGSVDAPNVLRFRMPDSRYRYLVFCFATAHYACAARMKHPDAVLNETLGLVITSALADMDTFFGGRVNPQEAATQGAALLNDFLHRWSTYLEIAKGGNTSAATSLVAMMLLDTESLAPAEMDDGARLWPLASWIESKIPGIRSGF